MKNLNFSSGNENAGVGKADPTQECRCGISELQSANNKENAHRTSTKDSGAMSNWEAQYCSILRLGAGRCEGMTKFLGEKDFQLRILSFPRLNVSENEHGLSHEIYRQSCRAGRRLMLRSMHCSCRRLRSGGGEVMSPVTPAPGDLMLSLASGGICTNVTYTYAHTVSKMCVGDLRRKAKHRIQKIRFNGKTKENLE